MLYRLLYAVVATFKILKIIKKISNFLKKKFEELATKIFFKKNGDVFFL